VWRDGAVLRALHLVLLPPVHHHHHHHYHHNHNHGTLRQAAVGKLHRFFILFYFNFFMYML